MKSHEDRICSHEEKFRNFIQHLKKAIPREQCDLIRYFPFFNPTLSIQPQPWWVEAFDWYIAIRFLPGQQYGPFYKIGGDWFWPVIGTPGFPKSEKHCFFGLYIPKDCSVEKLEALYNFQQYGGERPHYVYRFTISPDFISAGAEVYVGPVFKGLGFQANPNSLTCDIVKGLILNGKVERCEIKYDSKIKDEKEQINKGTISTKWEKYEFKIEQIIKKNS